MIKTKLLRSFRLLAALAVMTAILGANPAFADTFYVSVSKGNDAFDGKAPGAQGNNVGPKKTIQAAINAAAGTQGSDTIIIEAGTYPNGANFNTPVSVQVRSDAVNGNVVTVNGGVTVSQDVSLTGGDGTFAFANTLTLTDKTLTLGSANILTMSAPNVTVNKGTIAGNAPVYSNPVTLTYIGGTTLTAGLEASTTQTMDVNVNNANTKITLSKAALRNVSVNDGAASLTLPTTSTISGNVANAGTLATGSAVTFNTDLNNGNEFLNLGTFNPGGLVTISPQIQRNNANVITDQVLNQFSGNISGKVLITQGEVIQTGAVKVQGYEQNETALYRMGGNAMEINDGSFMINGTAGVFDAPNGTLNFTGTTADATFDPLPQSFEVGNIIVNKANRTVTAMQNTTINNNLTVTANSTLNQGGKTFTVRGGGASTAAINGALTNGTTAFTTNAGATLNGTGVLDNISVSALVNAAGTNDFTGTLTLASAQVNVTGDLSPRDGAKVMRSLSNANATSIIGGGTFNNDKKSYDLTYTGGLNNGNNLAVAGVNNATGKEYAATGIRNLMTMELNGAVATDKNASISGAVTINDGMSFGGGFMATLTGDSQSHTVAGSLEDNLMVLGDAVTINGSTTAGANNGDLLGVTVGTVQGANPANTGSVTLMDVQRVEGALTINEGSQATVGLQGDFANNADQNNAEITGGITVGGPAAAANSTSALTLTKNAATNGSVTVNNGAVNLGAWTLTLLDPGANFVGTGVVNNANTFSFTASTGYVAFAQNGNLDVKGASLPNLRNSGALTLVTPVTVTTFYDANANLTAANNVSFTLSGDADFLDGFVGTFAGTGAFVTTGTTLTVSGNGSPLTALFTDLTINTDGTTSFATNDTGTGNAANNDNGFFTVNTFIHTKGAVAQDAKTKLTVDAAYTYTAGTYTSAGGFFEFETATVTIPANTTVTMDNVEFDAAVNVPANRGITIQKAVTFTSGVSTANGGAITIADNATIRVNTPAPLAAAANGTVTIGANTKVYYSVTTAPGRELTTTVDLLSVDNGNAGGVVLTLPANRTQTANMYIVGQGDALALANAANSSITVASGGMVTVNSNGAFPSEPIVAPAYTLKYGPLGAAATLNPGNEYVGTPTQVQVWNNVTLQLPAPAGNSTTFTMAGFITNGNGNVDINGRGILVSGDATFAGTAPFTNSGAQSFLAFTGGTSAAATQTVTLNGNLTADPGALFDIDPAGGVGPFKELRINSGAFVKVMGASIRLTSNLFDDAPGVIYFNNFSDAATTTSTVNGNSGVPNTYVTNLQLDGTLIFTGTNHIHLGHGYDQQRNNGQHGKFIQGYQGMGVVTGGGGVWKALDLDSQDPNPEFANVKYPVGSPEGNQRTFTMFFPNADAQGTPSPQTDLLLEVANDFYGNAAASPVTQKGNVGAVPSSNNYWKVKTISGTLSPQERYDVSVQEEGLKVTNNIDDIRLVRRFAGSSNNPWGQVGTAYNNLVDDMGTATLDDDELDVQVTNVGSAVNSTGVLFAIQLSNQRPVLETFTSTIAGNAGPSGAAVSPIAFTINEGEELDVSFAATVAGTYSFTAGGDTDNAEITSDGFKFTPNFDQAGTYTFTLVSTSNDDNTLVSDPVTVNVTVNNANRPPAFTDVAATGTATDATPFTFDFNAEDGDGDALTFSLDAASAAIANASIDASTGVFTFAPSFAQAEDAQFRNGQDFNVIVSDGNAQATTTVTITVTRSRGLCDVDGDGLDDEGKACDAVDASLILQAVAGKITLSAPQQYAADVTGAAGVTAFDAAQILRYVAAFPAVPASDFFAAGLPGAAKLEATGTIAWGEATTADDGSILLPLTLTGNVSNVYALQLEAEVDMTMGTLNGVEANLPDDWMVQYQVNEDEGTVTIVMAGTTPLTAGEVATLGFGLNNESAVLSVKGSGFLNEGVQADLADAEVRQVPTDFALDQNYPNPFNPTTLIAYSLPEASAVTLQVFDINGRLVQTLVNGSQEAGRYKVEWNGRNMTGAQVASGLYIYRIQTENFSSVKRMMLVK